MGSWGWTLVARQGGGITQTSWGGGEAAALRVRSTQTQMLKRPCLPFERTLQGVPWWSSG